MDQQTTSAATPPHTHSFTQPIKKHHSFFSIIGKIFLFLLLGFGLLLGGFYLGSTNPTIPTPMPTPTPNAKTASYIPTETPPSPTPASQKTKTVKAGLEDSTSIFKPYSIDVPDGWTDARETTVSAGIDKLTLTKNGYSVTIYQAPMGGGGCIYKGNDDSIALAQLYKNFADINGKSGQYRRSWDDSTGQTITYEICQKMENESYSLLSNFGTIKIVSPNPASAAMLTEIDGMISSLVSQ